MAYVDGFVIPVQKKNLAKYWKAARIGAAVWKEHGALDYKECLADDLRPQAPDGTPIPGFPALCGLKKGETLVFSYIVYRDRRHRDRVNARVMKDPRIEASMTSMPMDPDRMGYAGFKVVVDQTASRSRRRRVSPR